MKTKKKAYAIAFAMIIALICVLAVGFIRTLENENTLSAEPDLKYKLFETTDTNSYLVFLENFDYTNNEIVNISISTQGAHYATTYFVTYKDIAQEYTVTKGDS